MADIGKPERIITVQPAEVPEWEQPAIEPEYEPVPEVEPDRELVPA